MVRFRLIFELVEVISHIDAHRVDLAVEEIREAERVRQDGVILTAKAKLLQACHIAANGSLTARFTAAGDAQLDGQVDFDDILSLFPNYGASGSFNWQEGDFTYDGKVDFDDILALFPNYGGGNVFASAGSGNSASAFPFELFAESLNDEPAADPGAAAAAGPSLGQSVMGPQPMAEPVRPVVVLRRPFQLVQSGSQADSMSATSLAFAALAMEFDSSDGSGIGKKKDPLVE